jgi:hypothetical protein
MKARPAWKAGIVMIEDHPLVPCGRPQSPAAAREPDDLAYCMKTAVFPRKPLPALLGRPPLS